MTDYTTPSTTSIPSEYDLKRKLQLAWNQSPGLARIGCLPINNEAKKH